MAHILRRDAVCHDRKCGGRSMGQLATQSPQEEAERDDWWDSVGFLHFLLSRSPAWGIMSPTFRVSLSNLPGDSSSDTSGGGSPRRF